MAAKCAKCGVGFKSRTDQLEPPDCLARFQAQHPQLCASLLAVPESTVWHKACKAQLRSASSKAGYTPPPTLRTTRHSELAPPPPPPPNEAQGGWGFAAAAASLAAEGEAFVQGAPGDATGPAAAPSEPERRDGTSMDVDGAPAADGAPSAAAAAPSSASGGGTPGDWSKWRAGDCVEICGTGTLLDGLTGMLETREGEITSVRSLCRVMLDGPPPPGYDMPIVNVLAHQMRVC